MKTNKQTAAYTVITMLTYQLAVRTYPVYPYHKKFGKFLLSNEHITLSLVSSQESVRENCGSVVDLECLTRDRGFDLNRRHCVVSLWQDTIILA